MNSRRWSIWSPPPLTPPWGACQLRLRDCTGRVCGGVIIYITFSHLADARIQSDLQYTQRHFGGAGNRSGNLLIASPTPSLLSHLTPLLYFLQFSFSVLLSLFCPCNSLFLSPSLPIAYLLQFSNPSLFLSRSLSLLFSLPSSSPTLHCGVCLKVIVYWRC